MRNMEEKRRGGGERERSPDLLMGRKEVTFNWLKIFRNNSLLIRFLFFSAFVL